MFMIIATHQCSDKHWERQSPLNHICRLQSFHVPIQASARAKRAVSSLPMLKRRLKPYLAFESKYNPRKLLHLGASLKPDPLKDFIVLHVDPPPYS